MQLEESVTLFDDNKVENRFAELQITADGITSEVSRKVGNDEVISRINQTAETIKIQADKVNIEGATIFTDGRLSQNSLNNAYDAKGAASSALGDAKDYADNAVSGKANKTEAIARQQRIYYRKTSAGAPSSNTTWLTSSGNGYENWSLKIPPMTSGTTKYPYLYTAVQTQTVTQLSGTTCSCSSVLLDDTTTVIDGGTIITGDINANRIKTNLITAFQMVVSDLKALAATIGGFFIGDTDIHTKDVAITSNADDSVGLSSSVFTRTINGISRSNLKFAIGSKFGVDKSGTLYANGANVTNISADNISTGTIKASLINAMGESNGARATLTPTGLDIYNSSNQKKAAYGANAVIYGGAGTYPLVSVTGTSANFMQSANNYASVDSNGLAIYQNGTSVAQFGSSNRIGDYNHKHILITNTDLNVYDDDGSIPFQVSTANSSSSQAYKIAWYIKASSSYSTSAYFKGNIVDNKISVGVATSGIPTASNTITLTNAGTAYTITVSGVKYTFTRYTGIIIYKIENTNTAKRSCLVSFTQSYKETFVKENTHILDTRYQSVSIEDITGTCYDSSLYAYAGVAQLTLRVYRGSSSVSNGGLIYKGRLGGFAPIYECYMVGHINGVYAVSGMINAQGEIFVYNTSGASRTVSSSNYASLSVTYLLAQ